MKKNFYTCFILILLFLPALLYGQQQTFNSPLSPLNFVLNPALTAPGSYMEAGAFYRQQWAGFENAPRTAVVHGQFPLISQNFSIGGYLLHDETGLIDANEIGLTTAYKLKLGITKYDQLSIGISAVAKQLGFDGNNAIAISTTDPSLTGEEINIKTINFGSGFFYTTNRDMFINQYNSFFVGGSATQLVSQKNNESDTGRFSQRIHATGFIGARFINNRIILEPSAWVSYAINSPIDIIGTIKLELEDTFWVGLSLQTSQVENTLYLQLGYVFRVNKAYLKVGTSGNYGIGKFGRQKGLGYEFLLAYQLWNL